MRQSVQPDHPDHQNSTRQHDIRILCAQIIPATPSAPARPCNSPALRGQPFCFHHQPARRNLPDRDQLRAEKRALRAEARAQIHARHDFTLPTPTTREELQRAIGQVATRIAANQIDLRLASRLLATLESACRNLPPFAAPEVG